MQSVRGNFWSSTSTCPHEVATKKWKDKYFNARTDQRNGVLDDLGEKKGSFENMENIDIYTTSDA